MTDGEKFIYDCENKLKNLDLAAKKNEINTNIYPKLKEYTLEEQKKIANWLVEFWKLNDEWENSEKLSKKQKRKIGEMKKILEL